MSSARTFAAAALACAAVAVAAPAASQGLAPLLGEIRFFAGDYAPKGWAFCNGQVLPISQNTALFSILGTTYGGDGTKTFALPDMRGRSPVSVGQMQPTGPAKSAQPATTPIAPGERGGINQVTLTYGQMPAHSHQAAEFKGTATVAVQPKAGPGTVTVPADAAETVETSATGESRAVSIRNPYVAISCIIAIQGIFPSRN